MSIHRVHTLVVSSARLDHVQQGVNNEFFLMGPTGRRRRESAGEMGITGTSGVGASSPRMITVFLYAVDCEKKTTLNEGLRRRGP